MQTLHIGEALVTVDDYYLEPKFHFRSLIKFAHEWFIQGNNEQRAIKLLEDTAKVEEANSALWNLIFEDFRSTVENKETLFFIDVLYKYLEKTDVRGLPNTVAYRIMNAPLAPSVLRADIKTLQEGSCLHNMFTDNGDYGIKNHIMMKTGYPECGYDIFNDIMAKYTSVSREYIEAYLKGSSHSNIQSNELIDILPEGVVEMLSPMLRNVLMSSGDSHVPFVWDISIELMPDIETII